MGPIHRDHPRTALATCSPLRLPCSYSLLVTLYLHLPQQRHIFPTDLLFRDEGSRYTKLDVPLMSSLRPQSNHGKSPAFGHHTRNSSLMSLRTALNLVPSMEQRLALQVFRRRPGQRAQERNTQQCPRRGRLSTDTSESELTRIPDTRSRLSAVYGSGYNRVNASMPSLMSFIRRGSQHRIFRKPRHVTEPPYDESQTRLDELETVGLNKWKRKSSASNCHQDFGHDHRVRWSIRSFLRYEPHSVIIQPVKEHILRCWRKRFSPSLHSSSSAYKTDHSDIRRVKKQNVRLGRTLHIDETPVVSGHNLCCGNCGQSPRTRPQAHYFVSTQSLCTANPRPTENANPEQPMSPSRLSDCSNDEQSYFSLLPAICET